MSYFKRHKLTLTALALVLVLGLALSGVGITIGPAGQQAPGPAITVGGSQVVLTLGTVASAAGVADATADGVADDVQFQALLDALPAAGGKIIVLDGTYNFAATGTRAIANVTIEGTGRATYITFNGVNPVITAGGNNWIFRNLRTDAGSLNMGATTGWEWSNVTINATYYAYRTPVASTTGASWELPTGRSPTFMVAASDASTSSIAQADYVADGTADEVQIQAAIDALPAGGGTIRLTEGTFVTTPGAATRIELPSNVTLEGSGWATILQLAADTYSVLITNDDWVAGNSNIVIRNLKIDGTWVAGAGAAGALVDLVKVSDSLVDNVWVTRAPYYGIEICRSQRVLVKDSLVSDGYQDGFSNSDGPSGLGGGNGISESRDIYFVNNVARGNYGTVSTSGFEVDDGPQRVWFIGNLSEDNYNGFDTHKHADGALAEWLYFINNTARKGTNGERGFYLWDSANIIMQDNLVESDDGVAGYIGLGVYNLTGPLLIDGLSLDIAYSANALVEIRATTVDMSDIVLKRIFIPYARLGGVRFQINNTFTISDVTVTDSLIKNVNGVASGGDDYPAIAIVALAGGTATQFTIKDNKLYDDRGVPLQRHGIAMLDAGTHSDYNIEGNDLRGNTQTPPIVVAGTGHRYFGNLGVLDTLIQNVDFDSNSAVNVALDTASLANNLNLASYAFTNTANAIPSLLRDGTLVQVPTQVTWIADLIGSGVSTNANGRHSAGSGVTANSRGQGAVYTYGLSRIGTTEEAIDWDRPLYIRFNWNRAYSDAESTTRIRLIAGFTGDNQDAAMAAKGLGVYATNYAVYGESYGIAQGAVDLTYTLTNLRYVTVEIVHIPATSITWFINGTQEGQTVTANNIPSGTSDYAVAVQSVVNGVTGGVTVQSNISDIFIWQGE